MRIRLTLILDVVGCVGVENQIVLDTANMNNLQYHALVIVLEL